jgi:cyclopropane fatty-acyl-phospholipid synthase-like methyltransferase
MRKVARTVNRLADKKECRLLDIGCGPATLQRLLDSNIRYHGIDIAIQEPAPNLLERDILAEPIYYDARPFDIVVAQGLFEYLSDDQSKKFGEIAEIMAPQATFVVTYVNFDHHKPNYYWPYSNIQPAQQFQKSLQEHFKVERKLPTALNWNHTEPSRLLVSAPNMYLNVNIPFITSRLAAEYIYLCRLPG